MFGWWKRSRRQVAITDWWQHEWEEFYRAVLQIEVDLTSLPVPRPRSDSSVLLVAVPNVSLSQLLAACRGRFPVRDWEDVIQLVAKIGAHDRVAIDRPYAVWLRRGGVDYPDVPAARLLARGVRGITLPERVLLELRHYVAYRSHLDERSATLCTGTRIGAGDCFVSVGMYQGELTPAFFGPNDHYDVLGTREVVT